MIGQVPMRHPTTRRITGVLLLAAIAGSACLTALPVQSHNDTTTYEATSSADGINIYKARTGIANPVNNDQVMAGQIAVQSNSYHRVSVTNESSGAQSINVDYHFAILLLDARTLTEQEYGAQNPTNQSSGILDQEATKTWSANINVNNANVTIGSWYARAEAGIAPAGTGNWVTCLDHVHEFDRVQ